MIILDRKTGDGQLAPTGIPVHNLAACNQAEDGNVWVSYWDGTKVHKMVVSQSLDEIQKRVLVSRHGYFAGMQVD